MQPLADHGPGKLRGSRPAQGQGRVDHRRPTRGSGGRSRSRLRARAPTSLFSYWKEDEDAAETRALVEDAGRRCLTVAGDVGDRDHCRALVDRAVGELGRPRRARQQRRLPDELRVVLGDSARRLEFVFRTNILAMFHLAGRGPQDGARFGDHQYVVDPGGAAQPGTAALRDDQGCHQYLHRGARPGTRRARDPCQRRRSRSHLDPAGGDELSGREERAVRRGHAAGPSRTARRARAPCTCSSRRTTPSYISGEVIGATGGKPLH